MNVTQEYVTDLLNRMSKSKGRDAQMHEKWYAESCNRKEDSPISVWIEFERYSENWGFPDKDDERVVDFIAIGDAGLLASSLVAFKYPDLQNMFAHKIILGNKGMAVLGQLYAMGASFCRDTAIYAILHNAFYHDLRNGTFELPKYIMIGTPEWFVRLFFYDLYRYDGIYREQIYTTIITSIGEMCNLSETYLRDNIGSILIVIEQCYDNLDVDKKRELLNALDGMLLTDGFVIKEYNNVVERVVKARCKLMTELYSANYLEVFNDEMRQIMVRFEGWTISAEAKYHEINKEVAVMLSWHRLTLVAEMPQSDTDDILNQIYNRLKLQIVLAKHAKGPYKEALSYFIKSLNPDIPSYSSIITDFTENTNDLYFVLLMLFGKENLSVQHVDLIHERWKNEKDIVVIKANQTNIWVGDVKNLARSFGIRID